MDEMYYLVNRVAARKKTKFLLERTHFLDCDAMGDCVQERSTHPMPRSAEDSSGVPQTRQITAEQSPQVRGSVIWRAQLGQ